MTTRIATFLESYDFTAMEKDYIIQDLSRKGKSAWYLTKQLLLNKVFTYESTGDRITAKEYMYDLIHRYSIVKKSTFSTWRAKIPNFKIVHESQFTIRKTKSSTCKLPELETRLVKLIEQVENITGGYLSGKLIKEEGHNLFEELLNDGIYKEKDRITFSDGWLEKFLKRNDLKRKKGPGERNSVNEDEAYQFVRELVKMTNMINYSPDCIFNIDETGLQWRTIHKSGYVKGDAKRIKTDKDRITVMVGGNMSGTMKVPLLVVGKSENPRGFNQQKQLNLKSSYKMFYSFNKSAWVTKQLFKEYIEYLNEYFKELEMEIILLVDGPSIHHLPQYNKEIGQLTSQPYSNISIYYLKANCTSIIQPMDQEVIQSFKEAYRRLLSRHLLDECKKQLDNNGETTEKVFNFKANKYIKTKDALNWIIEAWNYVTQNTLAHAWIKAGFTNALNINTWMSSVDQVNMDNDLLDIKLLDEFNAMNLSYNHQFNNVNEMRLHWISADVIEDENIAVEQYKLIKLGTNENTSSKSESDMSEEDYCSNEKHIEELLVPKNEVFTE